MKGTQYAKCIHVLQNTRRLIKVLDHITFVQLELQVKPTCFVYAGQSFNANIIEDGLHRFPTSQSTVHDNKTIPVNHYSQNHDRTWTPLLPTIKPTLPPRREGNVVKSGQQYYHLVVLCSLLQNQYYIVVLWVQCSDSHHSFPSRFQPAAVLNNYFRYGFVQYYGCWHGTI